MHTPQDSSLGRDVTYPSRYDAGLLFPIPRGAGRASLGIDEAALPFIGHDRWHAYELGWLDLRGKPCVGTATLQVPCTSPNLIESKSLKLYLNSLNAERFENAQAVRQRIAVDLSTCAGASVDVVLDLPPMQPYDARLECIDALDLDIDCYGPPDAGFLHADATDAAEEILTSHLLKSNCPVTNQPDWATLLIAYCGPRIEREGLLRYVASFRDHADFHEQCVERIYQDLQARCTPQWLSVEARYTRRGGLDINPWRASHGSSPLPPRRELRQ